MPMFGTVNRAWREMQNCLGCKGFDEKGAGPIAGLCTGKKSGILAIAKGMPSAK